MKLALLLTVLLLATPAFADWKPVEKVDAYAVSGQTVEALYVSIGEKGPVIGRDSAGNERRAIAHTNFKLTWQRDYQPQGGGCVLKTARPKLIITYTLPKPAAKLAPAVQARWDSFAAGLAAHEKVHGAGIVDMVDKIVAFSTGLTVADDPDCTKVRAELTQYLDQLSRAQRRASRDFDKVEFGPGGNLQKLIAAFLIGG
ncbi:peptidase [Mesorhizobium loti]|uniref:Peptidase n=1 Tax=Rhizobium loti TaxID=381 RepID=A0A101KQH1_RHILI|nr:peptidase [Mesorhizobium loti]